MKRNHASIYLRYQSENEHSFLLDCGEGTQRQMLFAGINFMRISNIFISHWHADHWAGLIGLIQSMNLEKRKEPLFIYGPDAERFVGDILDLDYWGPRFKITGVNVTYDSPEPQEIYKGQGYRISCAPAKHTIPTMAYRFQEDDVVNVDIKKAEALYGLRQGPQVGKLKEKGEIVLNGKKITLAEVAITKYGASVVFSGDTHPCRTVERLATGADVLIHDATFEEEMEGRMHTGAKQAGQVAKAAGVRSLILTHFSRRYTSTKEHVEQAREVFPHTIAAKDFLRLELKRRDG